jgi:hypothetical protein
MPGKIDRLKSKRILFASSSRAEWFENPSAAEHFKAAPYSVDAIGYNLEKLGWSVAWAGWRTTRSIFRLARKIDEFKPDVIYTYGSPTALLPLVCRRLVCRHKKFKVVHGWDDHYGRIWGDICGLPGKVFMDWMEKRIVKNSDAVVTLSYALQRLGREWGVDCHYIPNGADELEKLEIGGEIKLEGRFKVVYTGDKAKWKKPDALCRAMRKLPVDVKLYLTGKRVPWLEQYESENCIFLGWLSKSEQYNVMSQADAFVCTSDQDCNAKLQEYLRWKKPIIGYDGEANLFFKNGHNALLTKDFGSAIMRLAGDSKFCLMLAENAAREIPVYSWIEIASQFDRYFSGMLLGGHRT